jgi:hypothetical protein
MKEVDIHPYDTRLSKDLRPFIPCLLARCRKFHAEDVAKTRPSKTSLQSLADWMNIESRKRGTSNLFVSVAGVKPMFPRFDEPMDWTLTDSIDGLLWWKAKKVVKH